jgi:hypothetical protein
MLYCVNTCSNGRYLDDSTVAGMNYLRNIDSKVALLHIPETAMSVCIIVVVVVVVSHTLVL